MKKLLLSILGVLLFGFASIATATSTFLIQQGGTSTTTAPVSQLIYGGTGPVYQSVPTTTASCSGNTSCTAFTIIGALPVTISSTGGSSGSWFVADTNYNQAVNSTSTLPIWFKLGIMASTTSFFSAFNSVFGTTTYASSTALTATNLFATNATTTNLGWTGILDSLLYTSHGGNTLGVATSSPTNGAGITLSGTGAVVGGSLSITNSGVISANCTGGTTCSGTNPLAISSFSFPFTPTTNFGTVVNSTGTPIWFTAGLMSSSTFAFGPSAGAPYFYGNAGLFSISSTSPWAQFAINPIAGQGSNQFVIGSSSATSFIVNNAGFVGIGTTSPYAALSVVGSSGVVADHFTATSTTNKNTLPFSTTTAITASQELAVPNASSSPTLTAGSNTADIQVVSKTASSSVRFADGAATRSLYPDLTKGTLFASSTLVYDGAFGASGSTTLAILNSFRPLTLMNIACRTDVGTAWVAFGNGTATSTAVQCANPVATVSLSTNNTWTMLQTVFIEIGHSASAPNNITVSAQVRQDAD